MPFMVEQVGYDPTPSDFQSAAMTTSATTPFLLICGGEETRTLKIPQCKCGAVTNFATPPNKKLTHSSELCESNCFIFLPGYFRQFPRQLNSTHSP